MQKLYSNEILDALYQRANEPRYAHKIAVQQIGGQQLTFSELMQSVDAIATNLLQEGFQHGDKVLLLVRPSVHTMQIVLSVIRAGGAVIIGDPAMGKTTFENRMRFAQPKWVFAESIILLLQKWDWLRRLVKSRGIDLPEISKMGIAKMVNVGQIPFLAPLNFNNLSKKQQPPNEYPIETANLEDDLMLIFTSGTTAEPKGVMHTLKSVSSVIRTIAEQLQLTDADVLYSYALHLTIPALIVGGSAVLPPRKVTVEKTIQAYQTYGITRAFEVPTHMKEVADHLQKNGTKIPSSMQDIMLGAAPVFSDFLRQLQDVISPRTQIWSIYGMTEILPVTFVNMEEKLAFDNSEGDLVGTPLKNVQVELASDGELLLSGDALFDRYLGQEKVFKHPSGDIAKIDEQGRIILLGRKKDMIIRRNYNIYPPLFEPIIREIPNVEDCAMVGIYNPKIADEEVILFVDSPNHDSDALRKTLLVGKFSIHNDAQPDHIFFCELPYSGRSRKVDKNALREDARIRLGIQNNETETVLHLSSE